MMIAALPRRQSDDLSGELFVAAYESQLGRYSEPHLKYIVGKALRTCKWFPTIAECIELGSDWTRRDDHTRRQRQAHRLISREEAARRSDQYAWCEKSSMMMTQSQVDAMSPQLHSIGLKCGALFRDSEGVVRPVRQLEGGDELF